MSYSSQPRYPYGLVAHPSAGVSGMTAVPGVAGMTPVPGMPGVAAMPGMTAVPVPGGLARSPNGMMGLYQTEKPSSLYPGGPASYPTLAQAGLLTQTGSLAGQTGAYYGGQPTYIPVSSPAQQRYLVSSPYGVPGAPSPLVSSPAMVQGATGYPLTAGAGLALASQSLTSPSVSTLSTQAGAQYPTYMNSQFTPLQISASQNPYAAASATGHPLYPGSPYASLQVQPSQIPGGRIAQVGASPSAATGLPLGYPSGSPQAFYQAP